MELFARLVEFQCFQHHVHSDLIAELKAVGEGFFGVVNFDGYFINPVFFNTGFVCDIRKSVGLDGWIVE
jgi:hypothetical protein